jgi:hypothetical protein
VEMILLDWTRMGRSYCLAGVVREAGRPRIVRPLPTKMQGLPVRNVGWSPFLFDGHGRWELFELVGPVPAEPEPPHLEDIWVRSLRPLRRTAPVPERRAILEALAVDNVADLFGAPLACTRAAVYLVPGQGQRSLATLRVPATGIRFTALRRQGAPEADVRVALGVPGLDQRWLPVKDHHLLLRVEHGGGPLQRLAASLQQQIGQMGDRLAVRLGLSRAFPTRSRDEAKACWLMADGFFSLTDPQG